MNIWFWLAEEIRSGGKGMSRLMVAGLLLNWFSRFSGNNNPSSSSYFPYVWTVFLMPGRTALDLVLSRFFSRLPRRLLAELVSQAFSSHPRGLRTGVLSSRHGGSCGFCNFKILLRFLGGRRSKRLWSAVLSHRVTATNNQHKDEFKRHLCESFLNFPSAKGITRLSETAPHVRYM